MKLNALIQACFERNRAARTTTMATPIINNIANRTAITEPRMSAAIKTPTARVARATPAQNLLIRLQNPER